jgi:hypothetical protein
MRIVCGAVCIRRDQYDVRLRVISARAGGFASANLSPMLLPGFQQMREKRCGKIQSSSLNPYKNCTFLLFAHKGVLTFETM